MAPTEVGVDVAEQYYHGKHGGTIVDFGALQREADKVEDNCRLNLDMTVMDAVEGALSSSN